MSEAAGRMRPAVVKLAVSCVLLVLVYSLEEQITRLLRLFVEESIAETVYLVLLAPLMLLTSYYIYRVYASVSTSVIEGPLSKLRIRSAIPTIQLQKTYIPNLKFLLENFRKPFSKENRRYIDLRFGLPYKYPFRAVEREVGELVQQHNSQAQYPDAHIEDFRLVMIDLADYSVVYELRVKPSNPVFPEAMRSSIRRLVHEKFGEDLATPMLLDIKKEG